MSGGMPGILFLLYGEKDFQKKVSEGNRDDSLLLKAAQARVDHTRGVKYGGGTGECGGAVVGWADV